MRSWRSGRVRPGRTRRMGAGSIRAVWTVGSIRPMMPVVVYDGVVDIDVAAAPVEASEHAGADCHACAEGKKAGRGYIAGRRNHDRGIVPGRIGPCRAVENRRVVRGDIDDFRIGRHYLDDVLFDDHLLLCRCFEASGLHRFVAETLNGGHDVSLLGEKGVAEILSPIEVFVHPLEDIRKKHERLDAGVPTLLVESRLELVAFESVVGFGPPCRLHHLQRIGGRHEDLRQQRIRIRCNGRHQLFELGLRELGGGAVAPRSRPLLRRCPGGSCEQEAHEKRKGQMFE